MEMLEWIKAGNAMREERRSRGVTLRKEIERLGVDAVEYSRMERGIVNPHPPGGERGAG
jgi:transcriptional regulator with XRE-family HTH domain